MRLIVLDTNVIVSARINAEGIPSRIVNLLLDGRIQLVTSPCVVAEYREVTARAKFHSYGVPPIWLETLIRTSLSLPDPESFPQICPDPKDAPFLALAHAAGAWLVTGNIRHFPEQVRGGVVVLTPAEYLAQIS
ncbi:MAG TPA: putative toxin-antitoxin system toxin component, PIN family [Terracidiphilus sp.]|jgi:putative PIN family toxin of toxin-antitoxin system